MRAVLIGWRVEGGERGKFLPEENCRQAVLAGARPSPGCCVRQEAESALNAGGGDRLRWALKERSVARRKAVTNRCTRFHSVIMVHVGGQSLIV